MMSPDWLHRYSTMTGNYTYHPEYLEIGYTTLIGQAYLFQQAMQVELVAPRCLKRTDQFSVTVTIAMNKTLAETTDHDPTFGISDGKKFMGFTLPDVGDYNHRSPCERREGRVVDGRLKTDLSENGPLDNSKKFPAEVKLHFRPAEQWGACRNTGYVYAAKYQQKFDFARGLYLHMYHEDDPETYRIKYMEVCVHMD